VTIQRFHPLKKDKFVVKYSLRENLIAFEQIDVKETLLLAIFFGHLNLNW